MDLANLTSSTKKRSTFCPISIISFHHKDFASGKLILKEEAQTYELP